MNRSVPSQVAESRERVESSRPLKIGILGHVGNRNLGDEAIIAAVLQNLRRRWPQADICGLTIVPTDTERRHGIRSFAIRRGAASADRGRVARSGSDSHGNGPTVDAPRRANLKALLRRIPVVYSVARATLRALQKVAGVGEELVFLRASRRSIKGLDLLIVAGSHQLNDFVGGAWAYPYTVFKWTLLARLAGARVVFLSVGAGPIDTWLGRRFIRSALKMASYRSYRDETGKRVIDTLCPGAQGKVVPDLAFSLDLSRVPTVLHAQPPRLVGLNPLPLYAPYWYASDDARYRAYVDKLAHFSDWVLDRGYDLRFIPTQLNVDPPVIDDVQGAMSESTAIDRAAHVCVPSISSLGDLLARMSELDFMIATRYHGIILALALNKPVLALAYHQKSKDVMNWLGLGDFVLDGDTFDVAALMDRFRALEAADSSVRRTLKQKIPGFRSAVMRQYDEVFRLAQGASHSARVARLPH